MLQPWFFVLGKFVHAPGFGVTCFCLLSCYSVFNAPVPYNISQLPDAAE